MKRPFVLFLAFALCIPSVSASERLFVQVPAMFDPSAPIPSAVRNECALEMLLGNYALSAIDQRAGPAQSVATAEQAGAGRIVQLTIISVHGFGGGAWSGAKSMSIRADIKKEGKVVGSTVLKRSSRGGAFGGFYGTCAILDRVATTLGKDVANWLARGAMAGRAESGSQAVEQSDEADPPAGK